MVILITTSISSHNFRESTTMLKVRVVVLVGAKDMEVVVEDNSSTMGYEES